MINDKHFAVIVGINRYPGIKNQLTTARQDAEAFADWLKDPNKGGLPEDNVSEIWVTPSDESGFVDPSQAKPKYQNVLESLQRFHEAVKGVSDEDWPRTRLYIYAAGHGLVPPAGYGALIFANFNPDPTMGYVEYLDLGKYSDCYEKFTPFFDILLFADCCRELRSGMPLVSDPPFYGKHRGTTRRVVGYATEYSHMAGAKASATSKAGSQARGFFTKALLDGLEGKADCDPQTGIIDSSGLKAYIEARVPELAAEVGYKQRATITTTIPEKQPIPLARREEVPNFEVTVRLPVGWRGDVALVTQPPGEPVKVMAIRAVATEQEKFSAPGGLYWFVGGDTLRRPLDESSILLESDEFRINRKGRPDVFTLRRKV